MTPEKYVEGVLLTESKPERINFGPLATHALLGIMVNTSNIVDIAKKTMFYGKPVDAERMRILANELGELAQFFAGSAEALTDPNDRDGFESLPGNLATVRLDAIDPRLLHVGMGCFTESGEIIEAIHAAWSTDTPYDRVNVSEELGDIMWYLGVGSDTIRVPFEVLWEQNRIKLLDKKAGRYKQGAFNIEEAITRNLTVTGERGLLESTTTSSVGSIEADNGAWRLGKNGEVEINNAVIEDATIQKAQILSPDDTQVRITQNIYYSVRDEEFVLYDESALEHARFPTFEQANDADAAYHVQLNGGSTAGGVVEKLKDVGSDVAELARDGLGKIKERFGGK